VVLARRNQWRVDGPLEHRLPRLALASIAMGVAVWVLREMLDRWLGAENAFVIKVGALAGVIAVGMGVYLAIGLLIGGIDVASIRAGLRGERPKDDDPLLAAIGSD
jgi:putative peptidoglycan lipid II flippase